MRIDFLSGQGLAECKNKKLTIREKKTRDKAKNERRRKEQAGIRQAEKELGIWMKMAYAAEIHRLETEEAVHVDAWVRGFFLD